MKYLIVIERTATGYSAYSPDVPGCMPSSSGACWAGTFSGPESVEYRKVIGSSPGATVFRSPEPPSGSAARLTARACSRGNLESARAPARPVEIWRLNESAVLLVSFGCVPPRRSAQDGASGEESMLTPDTHGRQRHRQAANHGDSRQRRSCAGGIVTDDATLVRNGDKRWDL